MNKSMNEVTAWLKALVHDGAHLRLDSRSVKPGDVFVAVPGLKADGRAFIRVAAARGAAGVLMETRNDAPDAERFPIASLSVDDLSKHLGEVAAAFYGDPSSRMTGVAVTGTNGKTTTTHWIAALLTNFGTPCAVMGTVGCRFAGESFDMPALTTPDAVSLQGVYADLEKAGAKAFAVEASSIGLEQGRMTGSHFDTAVFTNLTRDHLDYHVTMDAYAEAKAILFAWPGLRTAVVNVDDPYAGLMAETARKNGAAVWATTLTGVVPFAADHVVGHRGHRGGHAFPDEGGRSCDVCAPCAGGRLQRLELHSGGHRAACKGLRSRQARGLGRVACVASGPHAAHARRGRASCGGRLQPYARCA